MNSIQAEILLVIFCPFFRQLLCTAIQQPFVSEKFMDENGISSSQSSELLKEGRKTKYLLTLNMETKTVKPSSLNTLKNREFAPSVVSFHESDLSVKKVDCYVQCSGCTVALCPFTRDNLYNQLGFTCAVAFYENKISFLLRFRRPLPDG